MATALAAATSFGLAALAYKLDSILVALIAASMGFMLGFIAATLDRHKE